MRFFELYVEPTPIMLPFKIIEEFTKPLSLSFRLFGNILADELAVGVLVYLVPLIVPLPVMLLGLFTSAIQARFLPPSLLSTSEKASTRPTDFQNSFAF